MPTAPIPLHGEHAVYAIDVAEIVWAGYRMTCPECGAATGWSLRVQRKPWTCGEEAWAVCVHGHEVPHPLIYPQMVHALIAGSNTPEGERAVTPDKVLQDVGWRPHQPRWIDSDSAEELPIVSYHPWVLVGPAADYWETQWRDLVTAAREFD